MMGREYCQMCEVHRGKIFCSYYDVFTHECHEINDCPEGLDDDEPEYYEGDDYPYDDEDYMSEERNNF